MAPQKRMYYAVWEGRTPGVHFTWDDCWRAVHGPQGGLYQAFPTIKEARDAYIAGPAHFLESAVPVSPRNSRPQPRPPAWRQLLLFNEALCVDATFDARTRTVAWRGVWLADRSPAFDSGPHPDGESSLGEFLALVHGLQLLSQLSLDCPIYTDSVAAIQWVQRKRVNSRSRRLGHTGSAINQLVDHAQRWLEQHAYVNEIRKWDTASRGTIPADFGRRGRNRLRNQAMARSA